MQVEAKLNISLPLPIEEEFSLEINLVDKQYAVGDKIVLESEPPSYVPIFVNADDYPLPQALIDQVWQAYNDNTNVKLEDDNGEQTIYLVGPYELARYGRQLIHIYSPNVQMIRFVPEIEESELDEENETDIIASLDDKILGSKSDIVIQKVTGILFGQVYEKTFIHQGNRGIPHTVNGITELHYHSKKQRRITERLNFSNSEEQRVKYWYDNSFVYVLGWTPFFNETGEQLKERPTNKPYDNIDRIKAYACACDYDPKTCDKPYIPYNHFLRSVFPKEKEYTKFRASQKCYGSMIVAYNTSYFEYALYYQMQEVYRQFTVDAGAIEKIGYHTYAGNSLVEWAATVNVEKSDDYYQLLDDQDSGITGAITLDLTLLDQAKLKIGENPARNVEETDYVFMEAWVSNEGNFRTVGITKNGLANFGITLEEYEFLRLFNKLTFKTFSNQPLGNIFASSGKRAAIQSLSATPNFLEVAAKDIPKVAVYEKRERERVYPDYNDLENYTEVERKQEVTFVDVFGEVTHEKLEK